MDQQGLWDKVNVMSIEQKASIVTLGMSVLAIAFLVVILVL